MADYHPHDNEVSFFVEDQQPIMVPLKSDKIVRNNNPIFYQAEPNKQLSSSRHSHCLNVLTHNKISSKMDVNEQFIDFVANDTQNQDLAIVSFMGSKKVGKSFLIDCIVSHQERGVSREMTKNSKPLINMPTKTLLSRNNEKVILFDCDGHVTNQRFLWTYFLSSVVVLNLHSQDRSGEEEFLGHLSFLQSHLDSDPEDLSLPKLIVLRRDAQNNEFKEKDFLKRVQEYGLFQKNITPVNINYPGSVTVKAKEIIDVPDSALNKSYLSDVIKVSDLIKSSARPKIFRGNVLGSKILSLAIDPLTKSINKDRKVNSIRIWDDVIETLSVGYYNYYILKYSEQLQKEFEDEKPSDKYTLYKKLSSVKRRVDKKVEGFNNISGDPIFEKYREKLNEKIISKEKLIKEINRQKSRKVNDEYCKKLFREMDDANCAKLIEKYCESDLDDQKTEVLLENFEGIISQRIKDMERSKDPSKKPSREIKQLQEELEKVQREIKQQKQINVAVVAYDFDKLKSTINTKEKQLNKLEKQLEQQKEISNKKKTNQNKDIIALEQSIEELKEKSEKQQKEIQLMRADREKKVQSMTKELQEQLKREEDKLAKLEELVKKAKESTLMAKGAQQGTKDNGCCEIM